MATMNPVLRLRQAFRSVAQPGSRSGEQLDEAADAITCYSYRQRESDLRHAQMMAEMREYMAEIRTQISLPS